MCLTVDKLGNGQDVVLTGSKDHHVKVRDTSTHTFNYLYSHFLITRNTFKAPLRNLHFVAPHVNKSGTAYCPKDLV